MTVNTAENTADILDSSAALLGVPAAPAPLGLDDLSNTAARPIPLRQIDLGRFAATKRRRVRVDWYLIGVLLLMLLSAAACFSRLAGAMHL